MLIIPTGKDLTMSDKMIIGQKPDGYCEDCNQGYFIEKEELLVNTMDKSPLIPEYPKYVKSCCGKELTRGNNKC